MGKNMGKKTKKPIQQTPKRQNNRGLYLDHSENPPYPVKSEKLRQEAPLCHGLPPPFIDNLLPLLPLILPLFSHWAIAYSISTLISSFFISYANSPVLLYLFFLAFLKKQPSLFVRDKTIKTDNTKFDHFYSSSTDLLQIQCLP